MIANDTFSGCFGSVPAGDGEALVRVVVMAVRAGYAVVLCKPGTKVPMCTLTVRQAKQADTAAQAAAKEAGDTYWARRRHACGLHHALTDDVSARRITTRLVKAYGQLNIGVELGRSRMVVVDVDTAEEDNAFLHACGDSIPGGMLNTPTVLSPGSQNADGAWAHKDGGHYWFTLPDGVELPEGLGVVKGEGGWAVMWRDKQVLVPPSVRPEGAYRLVGQPTPAPDWLLEFIRDKSAQQLQRRERAVREAQESDSAIDRWAATATWADLLLPDEWTDTGLIDNCGCPIWTAPGLHASHKSATAHEIGCMRYDTLANHAPLHIWTDNPPEWVRGAIDAKGVSTITKLTYLAYRFYGGNDGAALRGMGIGSDTDAEFPGFTGPPDPDDPFFGDRGSTSDRSSVPEDPTEDDEDLSDRDEEEDDLAPDPVDKLLAQFLTLDEMDDLPDLEPLVAGVLDLDTINRVIGKSNHGKTFMMIDLTGRVATGTEWCGRPVKQGLVVYVAAEGSRGFRKRARAWERHHGLTMGENVRVLPLPVQATDYKAWHVLVRALEKLSPALVVFDTQARITVGADENSAQDMGILVERVEAVRRATGACTILVHHLGHNGEHGRGSSAMIGAMSTEIRVSKDGDRITVSCSKQKELEAFEDEMASLVAVSEFDSVALVYEVDDGDPFDSRSHIDDDRPLWQRMASIVGEAAPTLGLTRADAISLTRDRYGIDRRRRTGLYKAWDKIVDQGWLDEILHPETGRGTGRFVLCRPVEDLSQIDPE